MFTPSARSITARARARVLSLLLVFAVLVFASVAAVPAHAQGVPDELKGIGITEHSGDAVSIHDLRFNDESGAEVKLDRYFASGKPVILNLVYYECPNLCTFVLNGLVETLRKISWTPGDQFEVVSVSINPREKPELAARKKAAYLEELGRPAAAKGWHFLTGSDDQIRRLAAQVGFGYRYDEAAKQYAHAAASYVLTPDGRISRYLYGIEYRPQDVRLALLEASNGKIGGVVDRILLFCYRYDQQTKKYSLYLTKLMQAGCGGTVLVFGGYLAVFWRRQRRSTSRDLHV